MKKIVLSAILFFISSSLFSQWVQTNGIKGCGNLLCFHKANNGIFAGTIWGLYKSTDDGVSWKISTNGISKYYDTRSVTSKGDTIFAGTVNGLYISYDGGNSWNPGPFQNSTGSYIFFNNGRLFYYVGNNLYYSDDFGSTFGAAMDFNSIESMYSLNNILYIADFMDGVFRSTDNGISWTTANNGLISLTAWDFTSVGNTLFLCTVNYPSGSVYCTTNNGDNWTQCNSGIPYGNANALSTEGSNLFAASGNIYFSSNNGNNWINRSNGLPVSGINTLLSYSDKTFAGYYSTVIYKTTNQGINWAKSDSGFYNTWQKSMTAAEDRIYASANTEGLWCTSNNGDTWYRVLNGSTSAPVEFVKYLNGKLYAGTTGNSNMLFVSSNLGNTWDTVTGLNGYCNDLTYKDTVMFAATKYGVRRSYNGGLNWSQTSFPSSVEANRFVIKGNALFAASNSGIFYTTNYGNTWLTCGITSSVNVNDIAAVQNDLYAATSNKVYRSTDNGINWFPTNSGSMYCYSLLVIDKTLFVASNTGVFSSVDGGQTWISVSEGLSLKDARSLLRKDDFAYLGTCGAGVYKRPLSQIIGIKNISSEAPVSFSLSQNYPNPFNPVTKIKFDIAVDMRGAGNFVTLKVYDISGREIKTLVSEFLKPGTYEATFDGSGLPSGIYYCSMLIDGGFRQSVKMILLK